MPATAEEDKALLDINIACFVTCFLNVLLWMYVLVKMLIRKATAKFFALIIICVLMITAQIANVVYTQLIYTMYHRYYKGVLKHPKVVFQLIEAFIFICYTTFYLAHWLFAFSYLVLSYQIELNAKRQPLNIYNRRLNAVNITVCLLTVLLQLLAWVFNSIN